jgi:hypothetical protein
MTLAACVSITRNNPDMRPHFDNCVTRENRADQRSGWRDREDSEINRLCVAEARENRGQPVAGARVTPEQHELDVLWEEYAECSGFGLYKTKTDVALCEAEISGNIDAAMARHEARKEGKLDREQRERHHGDTMGAIAGVSTAATTEATAQTPGPAVEAPADRREQAAAIAKVAAPWWCFEGTIGSLPTGWCAQSAEVCKAEIDGFAKLDQARVSRICAAQPLAACVGATKVLLSTRQVDCFATFAGCESFRTHLQSGADYSGVTSCEGMPTPWVPARPTASSPF